MRRTFRILILMTLLSTCLLAGAQTSEARRVYTNESPLVYEDVEDFWPYSFRNDEGKVEGYNVDLVRLLCKRLNIPLRVEIESYERALSDLKEGRSDLMLGVAAGFHDEFGQYSRNAIALLTQSCLAPKTQTDRVSRFKDLATHKVIVNEGSMCQHLMLDYGWGANAQATTDMAKSVQELSNTENGQIVWNTLSLRWLLRRYHLDNLEISPVEMPYGEYKFMSNDTHLLSQLDSIYTVLASEGELQELQDKWLNPEKQEETLPVWFWGALAVAGVLIVVFLAYNVNYRIRSRRLAHKAEKANNYLSLILETSAMSMWTYDVSTSLYTWYNDSRQVTNVNTADEFAKRYHPDDYQQLQEALNKLLAARRNEANTDEVMLYVREREIEDDSIRELDFMLLLSVLEWDADGYPSVILGTMKEITDQNQREHRKRERYLHYRALFETPMVCVMYFDRDGYLSDINDKACDFFLSTREEIMSRRLSFHELLNIGEVDMDRIDDLYITQIADADTIPVRRTVQKVSRLKGKLVQELRFMTVRDDKGERLGFFAVGHDVTRMVKSMERQRLGRQRTKIAMKELTDYVNDINYILRSGGVRTASYSPSSHVLTIFRGVDEVQLELTQARCMTLVHEKSQKKAMHMLNRMDNSQDSNIVAHIKTTLRVSSTDFVHLEFHFVPVRDEHGRVKEYFGFCRDVTDIMNTQKHLAEEAEKAQEVENAQTSFLKNMSYEIRTPLNAVVGFAELFESEHTPEDEEVFIQEILDNSDLLLNLINGILFLSRLDAHMIEVHREPCDFSMLFDSLCEEAWEPYRKEGVDYIIENPYEQVEVEIDINNLSHIIKQVVGNAARYTERGSVRAHYNYIGQLLIISVEDTGPGIPQDVKDRIEERFISGPSRSGGLGIPICRELTALLGGRIWFLSKPGEGSTVWVSIPCNATSIKRKSFQ